VSPRPISGAWWIGVSRGDPPTWRAALGASRVAWNSGSQIALANGCRFRFRTGLPSILRERGITIEGFKHAVGPEGAIRHPASGSTRSATLRAWGYVAGH
jgi:hypothetical protein